MSFCTEPYGCVMGRPFGRLGDVFTVNPGDCGPDASTVAGLLWQIRQGNIPAGSMMMSAGPGTCYTAADVPLVKSTQYGAGLPETGVVDDATLQALADAANKAAGPPATMNLPPPQVTAPPLTITASPPKSSGGGWLALLAAGAWLLKGK